MQRGYAKLVQIAQHLSGTIRHEEDDTRGF